jgi:DNA-binding protein H-NS
MSRDHDADLSALPLAALRALRARIDAELEERLGTEDANLRSRIDDDLEVRLDTQDARLRARGGLVERDGPRYRNPENSAETWSGKKPRPEWIGEALAKGYTLSDLEIIDDRPTQPEAKPAAAKPAPAGKAARKTGRRA